MQIGAVFLGFWLFKRKFLVLTVCFLVISGSFWAWKYFLEASNANKAVITAKVAELRSGPGLNFPSSASVPEGYAVRIKDSKDNWLMVRAVNGDAEGWVDKNSLEEI